MINARYSKSKLISNRLCKKWQLSELHLAVLTGLQLSTIQKLKERSNNDQHMDYELLDWAQTRLEDFELVMNTIQKSQKSKDKVINFYRWNSLKELGTRTSEEMIKTGRIKTLIKFLTKTPE